MTIYRLMMIYWSQAFVYAYLYIVNWLFREWTRLGLGQPDEWPDCLWGNQGCSERGSNNVSFWTYLAIFYIFLNYFIYLFFFFPAQLSRRGASRNGPRYAFRSSLINTTNRITSAMIQKENNYCNESMKWRENNLRHIINNKKCILLRVLMIRRLEKKYNQWHSSIE